MIIVPGGQNPKLLRAGARLIGAIESEIERQSFRLPSLPEVVTRVRQMVADPNVRLEQLERAISLDPAIAGRLVGVANSSVYARDTRVESLAVAIQVLGMQQVRNMVMALGLRSVCTLKGSAAVQMREVWRQSTLVAAMAHILALRYSRLPSGEALLAGLLHRIGMLPLLMYEDRHPELVADLQRMPGMQEAVVAELGQWLLERWGFSPAMAEVPLLAEHLSRRHAGAADCADLVIVGHMLAICMEQGGIDQQARDGASFQWSVPALQALGISAAECAGVLRDAVLEVREIAALLGDTPH